MIMPSVVIVDYGVGNLFSVAGAVRAVGIENPVISSDPVDIAAADRVILPGVGAFGDGMENLLERGLVSVMQDRAAANHPILGICLGMQLLMEESDEFGTHQGLGVIRGSVTRFATQPNMKVPLVGWEPIVEPRWRTWTCSVLAKLETRTHMYFVHSYYVKPSDTKNVLATTRFGGFEFCSVVNEGNTTGVQFHPERSGEDGIQVYRNFMFGID
jgi:glutamine amidotransferase